MKDLTIFTNWHFIRLIRLIIGIYFLWQAINTRDSLSAFIGSFLLIQAWTNTGCCGSGGCHITNQKSSVINENEDIEYIIIKP